MTKENRIKVVTQKIATLEGRGDKNFKCPGVLRKLKRELRNLKK